MENLTNKELSFLCSRTAEFRRKSEENLSAATEAKDKEYVRNQIRECENVLAKIRKMMVDE